MTSGIDDPMNGFGLELKRKLPRRKLPPRRTDGWTSFQTTPRSMGQVPT
jgi:hypothetical protein